MSSQPCKRWRASHEHSACAASFALNPSDQGRCSRAPVERGALVTLPRLPNEVGPAWREPPGPVAHHFRGAEVVNEYETGAGCIYCIERAVCASPVATLAAPEIDRCASPGASVAPGAA